MFLLTLMLFSVLKVAFCNPYECFIEEREKCSRDILSKKFPETSEELRAACNDFSIFGSCLMNTYEICQYSVELLDEMRIGINYINSVCKEDNPIYKVLSRNIKCIAPVARKLNESCNQFIFNDKNRQIAARHEKEISDNYERKDMLECLSPFWDVSCQSITMELHCGSEVKEAVNKILVNTNGRYQKCTNEILEELQPLYETYRSVIRAQQKLNNAPKE